MCVPDQCDHRGDDCDDADHADHDDDDQDYDHDIHLIVALHRLLPLEWVFDHYNHHKR